MTQFDINKAVDFITQDTRDMSVKKKYEKIWEELKNSSPLERFLYSKHNNYIFEKGDIEQCQAAVDCYMKLPVFNNKLNKQLVFELGFSNVRLTADVMTSAGWLIKEFLCDEIRKRALSRVGIENCHEIASKLKENDYKSMNAFLRCVYTHGNFTIAGKNRSSGIAGCCDQWDYALECIEKCKNEMADNKEKFLEEFCVQNKSDLRCRTNIDGYKLILSLFDDYIKNLYYQDYFKDKKLIKVIPDRKNIDWENVFTTYTHLILKRGLRIYCAIHNFQISESEKNIILEAACKKVGI